jgi:hypothetical protein
MSEGVKVPVVVPWSMVAAAAVAMIFMYRDVQTMKESMVKAERIAKLESEVEMLKDANVKHDATHTALWRARGSRPD